MDEETQSLHARVSQAHDYDRITTLWTRTVGSGQILCQLRRASSGPARRIVQLIAEYEDAGVLTTHTVQVESAEEEAREAQRLERLILEATIRPTTGVIADAGA